MIQQTKHDPKKIVEAAVVSGSMARLVSKWCGWWCRSVGRRDCKWVLDRVSTKVSTRLKLQYADYIAERRWRRGRATRHHRRIATSGARGRQMNDAICHMSREWEKLAPFLVFKLFKQFKLLK